jgi:hypothetical protein
MRPFRRTVIIVALCLWVPLSSIPGYAQAAPATPAPGEATGQKIGTIIKTAIQTALPGVSSLISLLFPGKSDSDKVKVADVKTTASAADTQKALQQQITAAIQPKLQPVSQVASELQVVSLFTLPSVEATKYIAVLQTNLASKSINWTNVSTQWSLVKQQLQKVKGVSDAQINSISDLWLRSKLSAMRDANDAQTTLIESAIAQKDGPAASAAVGSLAPVLDGMTAAAGYELANMQSDLTNLANWARGAAGSQTTQNPYKQIISDSVH